MNDQLMHALLHVSAYIEHRTDMVQLDPDEIHSVYKDNALSSLTLSDLRTILDAKVKQQYLIEKLILDGGNLARSAEQFQDAINSVDAAKEVLDEAEPGPDSTLAGDALFDCEQNLRDHWQGLSLSIYEFRKRAGIETDKRKEIHE